MLLISHSVLEINYLFHTINKIYFQYYPYYKYCREMTLVQFSVSNLCILLAAQLGTAQFKCAPGTQLCGNTCYDPAYQECHQSFNDRVNLCYKGEKLCGDAKSVYLLCYDPNIQDCYKIPNDDSYTDTQVCFKGQDFCVGSYAGRCYNPNSETCILPNPANNNETDSLVCAKGLSRCGERECYNPQVQECLNDEGRIKTCYLGEKLCDRTCYIPTSHVCLSNEDNLFREVCSIGENLCGYFCYYPTRKVCYDDGSSNDIWRHKLCEKDLYDESTKTCRKREF